MQNRKRTLQRTARRAYDQLDGIFTDKEAWVLFKTAAWLESIGWVMLIVGIYLDKNDLPGHDWVLAVAGSLHGMFFIFYVLIVLCGHRSMGWSVKRFVLAEVVANIPFGAFVFEQWVARKRQKHIPR